MTHLGYERRHAQPGVDLEPIHGQVSADAKTPACLPVSGGSAAAAAG